MGDITTFNHMSEPTRDGRFTQKDLIGKINKIVKSYGYDSSTTRSIVNSFVTNGILETYNELGFQKWTEFIHGCVKAEIIERGVEKNGHRYTNV